MQHLGPRGDELTGLSRVMQWPDGPLKYLRLEYFCKDATDSQRERFAGVHPLRETLSDAQRIELEDDIGYRVDGFYTKELPLSEFSPVVRKFLETYFTGQDKTNVYKLSPIMLGNYRIEQRGQEKIVIITHKHLYAPDFRTYVTHNIHAFERQRRLRLQANNKPYGPEDSRQNSPTTSRSSFFTKDSKPHRSSSTEPVLSSVKPEVDEEERELSNGHH